MSADDGVFLPRTLWLNGRSHAYRLYLPPSYDASRRWPLILFLHGSGERGSDGVKPTTVGLGPALGRFPGRYPALALFPQIPENGNWQGAGGDLAVATLDAAAQELPIDPDRIYVAGISLGGNGAWHLLSRHAERFAAAVVVCGFVAGRPSAPALFPEGSDPYAALAERIRCLPTWIVHGEEDPVVPVSESRKMARALEDVGGEVSYRELPGVGHDCWEAAFADPELPRWLFARHR